jgi:hypothetical protein
MATRTIVRLALVLIATTALWGCGSPAAPTATGWCFANFSAILTRDAGPAGDNVIASVVRREGIRVPSLESRVPPGGGC